MRRETNLEEIKQTAKAMIYVGVDRVDEFGLISNPFTSSPYVMIDNKLVTIEDSVILNDWSNRIEERIDTVAGVIQMTDRREIPIEDVFSVTAETV